MSNAELGMLTQLHSPSHSRTGAVVRFWNILSLEERETKLQFRDHDGETQQLEQIWESKREPWAKYQDDSTALL